MRTFLVIVDETEEAGKALRYAAARAEATGGTVQILALVQPQNFNAFGGVQATIEQEARDRAEAIASSAAGNLASRSGRMPAIAVEVGEGHQVVRRYLDAHPEVTMLVLSAADDAAPGPLVAYFAETIGNLRCPVTFLPGHLSFEEIDEFAAQ